MSNPLIGLDDLAGQAKPVLNELLVVEPTEWMDGSDYGWCSREHALATALLAYWAGTPLMITHGVLEIWDPGSVAGIRCGPPKDNHFWCVSDSGEVVDLSITFTRFPEHSRHREPARPINMVGDKQGVIFPYRVAMVRRAAEFPNDDAPSITYMPMDRPVSVVAALRDAFSIMQMDPRAVEAACACACHAWAVVMKGRSPLPKSLTQDQARGIVEAMHPAATSEAERSFRSGI